MLYTDLYHLSLGEKAGSYRNYFHYLSDSKDLADHGQIALLIDIQSHFQGEDLAKDIFNSFKASFYQDLGQDAFHSLEQSLKEMNEVARKGLQAAPDAHMSAIAIAIEGNTVHAANLGASELFLCRNFHCMPVMEPQDSGKFTSISSGELIPNDLLLLSTNEIESLVSKENLDRLLQSEGDIEQKLHTLKDWAHETPDKQGLDMLFIACSGEEEPSASFHENFPKPVQKVISTIQKKLPYAIELSQKSYQGAKPHVKKVHGIFKNLRIPQSIKDRVRNFDINSAKNAMKSAQSYTQDTFKKADSYKGKLADHFTKDKKLFSMILIGFVLLAGVFAYTGYSLYKDEAKLEHVYADLEDIRGNLEKAKTRMIYDKKGAQTLLKQLKKDVRDIKAMPLNVTVSDLEKQIQTQLDKAYNIKRIENPELIADVSNERSDAKLRGLFNVENQMLAHDYNAFYTIVLDEVRTTKIAENASILASTRFEDNDSVMLFSEDKRLWEIKNGVASAMTTQDTAFQDAIALEDFRQYLYFLDPANNQVWKYTKMNEGFGIPQEYNPGIDLSTAVDFAIDGAIYIANENDTITKLFSNQEVDFNFTNMPQDIGDIKNVHTSDNLEYVYILDGQNNQIFQVSKEGAYRGMYDPNIDENITAFSVSEAGNKIFIATNAKVYSINL